MAEGKTQLTEGQPASGQTRQAAGGQSASSQTRQAAGGQSANGQKKQATRQMSPEEKRRRRAAAAKRKKQIMRRRRIFAACVIALVIVVVVLIAVLVSKRPKTAEVSTLTLNEDGTVTFEEVLDVSGQDITETELKSYVKSTIKDYDSSAESKSAVEMDKVSVDDGTAYVKTEYESIATYYDFSQYAAWYGTVQDAIDLGYKFNHDYVTVADGEKGNIADADTIMAETSDKVLLIKENVRVVVPGEICYVTNENTTLVDENTVDIAQPDGNTDATTLSYVIFK